MLKFGSGEKEMKARRRVWETRGKEARKFGVTTQLLDDVQNFTD